MTETNEQRLAEIEAREKVATPGPWEWEIADQQGSFVGLGTKGTALMEGAVLGCERCQACIERKPLKELIETGTGYCGWPRPADATFIAHARDDIPWLLGRIAELEAQVQKAAGE